LDFEKFFDTLVNSMNDLRRPEFFKIKVLTKNKYEREQKEMHDEFKNQTKNSLPNRTFQNATQGIQQN